MENEQTICWPYRAWDIQQKLMCAVIDMTFGPHEPAYVGVFWTHKKDRVGSTRTYNYHMRTCDMGPDKPQEMILLPFTTLILPNKQPVYDGDLIAVKSYTEEEDDGVYEAKWVDDCLQWGLVDIFSFDRIWLCEIKDDEDAYVCGNKYSHPEIEETGKWAGQWNFNG